MNCTERKRQHSPSQPTGQWISTKKRLAIYMRDFFSCAYCGTDLKNSAPTEISLDHLEPKSLGGTNDATNLVTSCRACNCSRGNRSLVDFAPGGALVRIETLRNSPLNVPLAHAILMGANNTELENR